VIAHKTGGLRDTVIEWAKDKGSGVVFDTHTTNDFLKAVERALKIFNRKPEYKRLRELCFENVIDVEDVSRAWDNEYHQLNQKLFLDQSLIEFYSKEY